MPAASDNTPRTTVKYARARIRHFFFTHGPHRISRGRSTERHLANDVILREIDVPNPRWPRGFDGLRIGHVSDFHYGRLMPVERALEVIDDLVQAEPDMIACTGDVIDLHAKGAEPIFEALGNANVPLGSYLVLGNHDELHDRVRVEHMARDAGVTLLENEQVEIHHNGQILRVAGVRWAKRRRACANLVSMTCDDGVHILLSHNPKSFPQAARLGVPLTLAGHTHGGQVALRNRPDTNLSIAHRRSAGLYDVDDSHLFVTTGVGSWFPLRVNCPPEVAVLTMRSSNEDDRASRDDAAAEDGGTEGQNPGASHEQT